METLLLKRVHDSGDSTVGCLIFNDIIIACTLENTWLSNVDDYSCIPSGSYRCTNYSSKNHPSAWKINDVRSRTDVLIHTGNYPKDTKGCVLIGDSFGEDTVWNSRKTMKKIKEILPKNFKLVIR